MDRLRSSMVVANVVFAIACSTPDASQEDSDAAADTSDAGTDSGPAVDAGNHTVDAGESDAAIDAAHPGDTECSAGTTRPCCAARGTETCNPLGVWEACSVVPSAEACNGIDDDCDGTTDDGVTKTCVVDADDDGYAGGTTSTEVCPDPSRAARGQCPVGFVDAASSTGTDCNDTNASVYRPMQTQVDHDRDRYCNSSPGWTCVGETTPPGLTPSSYCLSWTDCDDEDAEAETWRDLRNDADGDGSCAPGAAVHVCTMSFAPSGTRDASNCSATDDCNDADAATYRIASLRTDADGDTFCTAAAAVDTCIGASVPTGRRIASTCYATNDCADGNPWAASSCTMSVVSNSYDKFCDVGQYVTTNWTLSWSCPAGFHTSAAFWNDSNGDDGDDAYYTAETYDFANSTAHSDFVCRTAAIGHDYYFVSVTCVAN